MHVTFTKSVDNVEASHVRQVEPIPVPSITNKFAVLDPEIKLQQAYENLENSERTTQKEVREGRGFQELPLVLVANPILCLSDGTSMPDESNMGVLFTRSAPNSDGEQEFDPRVRGHIRKSKRITGAIRKGTRTGKDKAVPFSNKL